MSIRRRLTIWYAIAIAITVAAVGIGVWIQFRQDLRATLRQALAVQVADVTAALSAGDDGATLREDPARPGIWTAILGADGRVAVASRNAPPSLGPVTLGESETSGGATAGELRFAAAARDGRTVVAGSSVAGIDSDLERLAWQLAVTGLVAATASLAGGWWLARRALAPVAMLVAEAERIHGTEASLGDRLQTPNARDELGRLAATFNAMLGRVEHSLQRQRLFVASASHDLRTPIAALRTEFELALRGPAGADELRAAIAAALGDVERLGRLADGLLGLAAADGDGRRPTPGAHPLRPLVADAADAATTLGAERGVRVELEVEDVTVVVDGDRVTRAIGNLVANAVRHSPAEEAVVIRARHEAAGGSGGDGWSGLAVDVLDRGPGVAPAARPLLFVPFARGGGPGGAGLGLATAAAAVQALGGEIGYRDRPGGGAWFWFRVPAAPAPADAGGGIGAGAEPRIDGPGGASHGRPIADVPDPTPGYQASGTAWRALKRSDTAATAPLAASSTTSSVAGAPPGRLGGR